jgi:OFA family oxalate/formate antiporter-like MFS transporter
LLAQLAHGQKVKTANDVPFAEVRKSPCFWLMYVMYVLVAMGGLMVAAQLAPVAIHRNLETTTVLGMPLLSLR